MSKKKKNPRRKKHTALIMCPDHNEFWTTQTQFWQWIRDHVIVKTSDNPLTGVFRYGHEPLMVVIGNTILNLRNRNHISEALLSRRLRKSK